MFVTVDSDPSLEMTYIVSTISETMSQTSTASDPVADTSIAHNTSTLHNDSVVLAHQSHKSAPRQKMLGKQSSAAKNAPIFPPNKRYDQWIVYKFAYSDISFVDCRYIISKNIDY